MFVMFRSYGTSCLSCLCLSVPVQLIVWKDSSLKWPVTCWVDIKPYTLARPICFSRRNCIKVQCLRSIKNASYVSLLDMFYWLCCSRLGIISLMLWIKNTCHLNWLALYSAVLRFWKTIESLEFVKKLFVGRRTQCQQNAESEVIGGSCMAGGRSARSSEFRDGGRKCEDCCMEHRAAKF